MVNKIGVSLSWYTARRFSTVVLLPAHNGEKIVRSFRCKGEQKSEVRRCLKGFRAKYVTHFHDYKNRALSPVNWKSTSFRKLMDEQSFTLGFKELDAVFASWGDPKRRVRLCDGWQLSWWWAFVLQLDLNSCSQLEKWKWVPKLSSNFDQVLLTAVAAAVAASAWQLRLQITSFQMNYALRVLWHWPAVFRNEFCSCFVFVRWNECFRLNPRHSGSRSELEWRVV